MTPDAIIVPDVPSQIPADNSDASKTAPPLSSSTLQLHYPSAMQPTASAPPLKSPDMLPVIVSDYIDTTEGWLTKAEAAAQSAVTIEELAVVIANCRQGLQTKPTVDIRRSLSRLAAWAHTRRGELLAEAGQTQPAFAEFEAALRLDENCVLALHNRAVSFAQQNRGTEALRDFDRVIELNPGLAVAYRNRGELLASLGRLPEAIADYDRALRQLPSDVELYGARAEAWQRLGNYDRALADLNQALRIAPDEAGIFVQRASLAAQQGDFRAAVNDYQRAIDLAPQRTDGYRGLAWLLATCADPRYRDPEQAVEIAKRGLQQSQAADPELLDTLAAAFASAGQFELAAGAAQRAIAAAPPELAPPMQERLALYQQRQPYIEARTETQVIPANFEIRMPQD
jgi:tetratricopeptide (TPR) repeat protein